MIVTELNCDIATEEIQKLSPAALAYVGDAVYELWVRLFFLFPPKQMHAYHKDVVQQVKAENQANWLIELTPILTDIELDIVRRGRNSVTKVPKRLDHSTYRKATGLETLIGYLYLADSKRLSAIFEYLQRSFGKQG